MVKKNRVVKSKIQKHAEVPVTLPSTQVTKPSNPVKKSTLRYEMGDSGSKNTHGIIYTLFHNFFAFL